MEAELSSKKHHDANNKQDLLADPMWGHDMLGGFAMMYE